jgi:hypothetical protein
METLRKNGEGHPQDLAGMETHHQAEALEVTKGGSDHARNTGDGFKKENSLVCVRDNVRWVHV